MDILVVDDQPFLCYALGQHLEEIGKDLNQQLRISSAHTLSDAISAVCSAAPPELVFLDLNLSDDSQGTATLEEFQKHNTKDVRVVVFTGLSLTQPDARNILRRCLYELRAWTIVAKTTDLRSMFAGLPRLLAGEPWFSEAVVRALAPTPQNDLGLTPRQMGVLRGIERGLQTKEIANELQLSPHYVQQVTGDIFKKLGVHSRWAAARKAQESRL